MIYTLRTKQKSVWSKQYVYFYFKNKENANEFIKILNSKKDINIEFEHDEEKDKNIRYSSATKVEIARSPKDQADFLEGWAESFTREHNPRYKSKYF